ncbi:MAG: hypothetical protein UFG06_07935 [Lachnospiraceae bacterium]|nr:hypothetical protein [Lachnospiraceae bacterium]
MEKIYIALVNTPGFFAGIIRQVIQKEYIHVVVSMDNDLAEAYSIGRRNPFIPCFAGFEKEDKNKIYSAFPTARYLIYSIDCTREQKARIEAFLKQCYRHRFRYHYCIAGLPYILLQKPFYQKSHYTCSSFIARLLSVNGINLFDKHFSLVTPADFYDIKGKEIIFEGFLGEFLHRNQGGEEKCRKEIYYRRRSLV